MKIGAVIVTYNPDLRVLRKNVNSVIDQVEQLVIVDNGSENIEYINKMLGNQCFIIELGRNFGIATAQNKGFQFLECHNFDWGLTLDQDTILPVDYVKKFFPYLNYDQSIGLITGAYIDKKWSQEERRKVEETRKPEFQNIRQEIASGNIVSIPAWKTVGGFDEKLFIDYVDFEFDYRLQENSFKLYRLNSNVFTHEIGTPVHKGKIANLIGLKNKELFDHSPQRLYFINRNRLIVRKRYPKYGSPLGMFIAEVINLREILIMDKPRLKKLISSLKGIFDGTFYREKSK